MSAERVDRAAHEVAQAAIECGERVVENDPAGRCVTVDLYLLGLNAAKRNKVHPVRVLTAADDLIRGVRDYIRGPVVHPYGSFGRMALTEYDSGWWNV